MNGGDEVVVATGEPVQPLDWKFSQVFGERAAGEEVQEGNCFVSHVVVCFLEGTMLLDPVDCVWIRVWFFFLWIRYGSIFFCIVKFYLVGLILSVKVKLSC